VVVIHSLTLKEANAAFSAACERCAAEAREDAACMSLSICSREGSAKAVGVFANGDAARFHLERFQRWLSADSTTGLGPCCAEPAPATVQVLATEPRLEGWGGWSEALNGMVLFNRLEPTFDKCRATEASSTVSDFVEDVKAVLKYAGAHSAAVIGFSMGSSVALQLALDSPQHVQRLCVCGGSPKIGEAAQAVWSEMAGASRTWQENIVRSMLFRVDFVESALRHLAAPTMFLTAEDDPVTPLRAAYVLKRPVPRAILEVPTHGGHDALFNSDTAFERAARFLLADEGLELADDTLLPAMVTSPDELMADTALARYYELGSALARVESAARRARFRRGAELCGDAATSQGLGHIARPEKPAEACEALATALRALGSDNNGLVESSSIEAASKALQAEMIAQLPRMSAPARAAVTDAGLWWRDDGSAENGFSKDKYTVDIFGCRRGSSTRLGCAWFRWSPCAQAAGSEAFNCWWCGGAPKDHKDLGRAPAVEVPGYFPGLGPGGQPWNPPQDAAAPCANRSKCEDVHVCPIVIAERDSSSCEEHGQAKAPAMQRSSRWRPTGCKINVGLSPLAAPAFAGKPC